MTSTRINRPVTITNRTTGKVVRVTDWNFTRSLSQCFTSGMFTVAVTEDVRLQDEISIMVDQAASEYGVVILGWGRVKGLSFTDGNTVSVTWQSFVGVMADYDAEPNDWTYNTARDVIETVAGQFGVSVVWDAGIDPDNVPGNIVIDPGTKALTVIIDVCKLNGWVVEDQDGQLGITKVGRETYRPAIVRGYAPFISGSFSAEDKRTAVVSCNRQLPGENRRGKKKVEDLDLWGTATDDGALPGTRRYMRDDKADDERGLRFRAAVSSLVEGAGGIKYELEVAGLYDDDGEFWTTNKLVVISDPARRVLSWTGLIESVSMSQSATQAQRTKLTLVPPATYYSIEPDALEGATGIDPYKGLNVWR